MRRRVPSVPRRALVASAALAAATVAFTVGVAAPPAAGEGNVVQELLRALAARSAPADDTDPRRAIVDADVVMTGPRRWRPLVRDADAARKASLTARAEQRAYDGAPPVMPHSRNFVATKTCLDCHADGIWLGERFGPPLSHPHFVSCTQCHVESRNLDLPMPAAPVETTFAGRAAPLGGRRAWTGAPPVIPHGMLMRTRCASCHGPDALPGLRTSHPERLNCVQCHAPAASLDQTSPFFTGNATLLQPWPEPEPEPELPFELRPPPRDEDGGP